MKHFVLVQVADFLSGFTGLSSVRRVGDNLLELAFEGLDPIFCDLRRSASEMFMTKTYRVSKPYRAPFDVLLAKRFTRAKVRFVDVETGNRILRLGVASQHHYKQLESVLQLEFTGRHTNAVILDDAGVVQAALRYIGATVSFRRVCVGEPLVALPPVTMREQATVIEDIPTFLTANYAHRRTQHLVALKQRHQKRLDKKITQVQAHLAGLSDATVLEKEAKQCAADATLLLMHLHTIAPYERVLSLEDAQGASRTVVLPSGAHTAKEATDFLFTRAKKLRQKIKRLHLERQQLLDKQYFWEHLGTMIEGAESEGVLQALVPENVDASSRLKTSKPYKSFYFEGYKVMVGKNQHSNIALLQQAKSSDVWLHVKDVPSAHVLIRTPKKHVPDAVLGFAATLCVNFSRLQAGNYQVDYTPRRNVKIQKDLQVRYVDFKTLQAVKG